MKIDRTGVKLLPRYTGPVTSEGNIIVERSVERGPLNPYSELNDRTPSLKVIHENLRLLYAIKAVEAYSPVGTIRRDKHLGVLIDIYV